MLQEIKNTFDKVKLKHFMEPFKANRGKIRNGKTIAVIFDGNTRYVGVAECGRKDCYSRKQGREIALGRALRAAKNKTNNGTHFTFNVNNVPQKIVDNVPKHLYTVKNNND
jgi:hypothetical protein